MTITLEPALEAKLVEQARQAGRQPQEYLRDVISDALGSVRNTFATVPSVVPPAAPAEVEETTEPTVTVPGSQGKYYEEWKPFFDLMEELKPDIFAEGYCQPPEQPMSAAMEEWVNAKDA